jgi:hypothetical protein
MKKLGRKFSASLLLGAFALALAAMLTLAAPADASNYQQTAATPGAQVTPGSNGGGSAPGATAGAVATPITSPAATTTAPANTQDNGFPWWVLLIPLALLLLIPLFMRRRPEVRQPVADDHIGPRKSGVYDAPNQNPRSEERRLPRNPGGPQAE